MQLAGGIFKTRFIMIRMIGFAIYRTSKMGGGIDVKLFGAQQPEDNNNVSSLRGPAVHERKREKQCRHPFNAKEGNVCPFM